jgi:RimJ/RimL family protein N-acetyltransferase
MASETSTCWTKPKALGEPLAEPEDDRIAIDTARPRRVEPEPDSLKAMAFEPPASRSAFQSVWHRWLSTTADGSDFDFAVRHRETGGFIGLAALHDTRAANPELGIWVSEQEQGQVYGHEAARAAAAWSATASGSHAFRHPVAEANHPSRRIAEEMGGQVVGRELAPKYASAIYRVPSRAPQGGAKDQRPQRASADIYAPGQHPLPLALHPCPGLTIRLRRLSVNM